MSSPAPDAADGNAAKRVELPVEVPAAQPDLLPGISDYLSADMQMKGGQVSSDMECEHDKELIKIPYR